jgi:hypothetical protein
MFVFSTSIRPLFVIVLLACHLLCPAGVFGSTTTPADDLTANQKKSSQGYQIGDPDRYLDLCGPLRTEKAALSPDGKHVAYTVRDDQKIYLNIIALDEGNALKARILVRDLSGDDLHGATRDADGQMVDWLGWVNARRVVFGGNGSRFVAGVVIAVDADGSDARVLAVPADLREIVGARSRQIANVRVIGLDPGRPDSVILAASTPVLHGSRGGSSKLDRQLNIAYSLNALTGVATNIGESLVRRDEWALRDRLGRSWITLTADWSSTSGHRPPIRYQPNADAESSVTLDELTGIGGFTFGPENVLGESSLPLGLDDSGTTLYYASNVGRNTHGIYAFDLKSKQRLPGALESPTFDLLSPQLGTFSANDYYHFETDLTGEWVWGHLWWSSPQLAWDRFTRKLAGVRFEGITRTAHWYRPELQSAQEWLAASRPGRSTEIIDWDESLNRLLILEQAPSDAGAFYILDRHRATYTQIARRGAAPADAIAQFRPFAFTLRDGSRVDGFLAMPRNQKSRRAPLILCCPNLPWERRGTGYQAEFEALTRMGFAVAIYNGRGTWGEGIQKRLKLGGDYVAIQVEDLVAIADHLAENFAVSRRAVALFGRGPGGFAALRALQLQPDRFRAAVTVNAWIQGNPFFDAIVQMRPLPGSREKVTRPTPTPLTTAPDLIKMPVFTIVEFSQSPLYHANTALHRAVKKRAPDSELFVQTDKLADRAAVLARQWARTESFLNYVLYSFSVKLGETEVLPDEVAKPKQP